MSNIIPIHDLSLPALKVYSCLSENQLLRYREPETGIFIAESPKVISRALDAEYCPVSLLAEAEHLLGEGQDILARCRDIPVYTADIHVLTQLTGFHLTRGMLCAMNRKPLPSVEEVCQNARRIAVLEQVMNPTNVGAIIRSAAALGMDGVLLSAGCCDPLYRRAIRVSMGTVFQIPWTFFPSSSSPRQPAAVRDHGPGAPTDIELLRKLGFRTAAMALSPQSIPLSALNPASDEKLAVVLGTEGDGLAKDTIARCDYTVRIPMSHGVDSLNVAAASAVAFWQLRGWQQKK